jgi:NAD(P)H-dependent FMN reductase
MSATPKILAFAGSARKGSFHKSLVQIAAAGARDAGAEVTYIDLKDYPMPLYDQDLEAEQGFPDSVMEFKKLMKSHHGLLLACPEYNSSITPLLKNAIDWASRPEEGEPPLSLTCFRGKTAALLATSPGGTGGMRGLVHVRSILGNIGVLVIPQQKAIPGAYQAFDENGKLVDADQDTAVRDIGRTLAEVTGKLVA